MAKRKLATDSVVKGLFDPLKGAALEAGSSLQSPQGQASVFFRETRTERVTILQPPSALIRVRTAVKEKIFFWAFLFAFLLTSTHSWLTYWEEGSRLRQSQSLLELKQNELSFWRTELGERKEKAREWENRIRKIQAEEKDLAKNLGFLQSHLRSRKGYSPFLSELYRIQPSNVIFQEMSFQDSQLFLKGSASEGALLLEFFRKLRTLPALKGVEVSVQGPSQLPSYFYSFEVRGRIVA